MLIFLKSCFSLLLHIYIKHKSLQQYCSNIRKVIVVVLDNLCCEGNHFDNSAKLILDLYLSCATLHFLQNQRHIGSLICIETWWICAENLTQLGWIVDFLTAVLHSRVKVVNAGTAKQQIIGRFANDLVRVGSHIQHSASLVDVARKNPSVNTQGARRGCREGHYSLRWMVERQRR